MSCCRHHSACLTSLSRISHGYRGERGGSIVVRLPEVFFCHTCPGSVSVSSRMKVSSPDPAHAAIGLLTCPAGMQRMQSDGFDTNTENRPAIGDPCFAYPQGRRQQSKRLRAASPGWPLRGRPGNIGFSRSPVNTAPAFTISRLMEHQLETTALPCLLAVV